MLQEREVNAGIELQVRRASNALKGARERVVVEEASVAMAEENLRIVRNRYESGLTTVTELLRSEVAVAEVRTRRLAAVADVRLAAVAIDLTKEGAELDTVEAVVEAEVGEAETNAVVLDIV